MATSTPIPPPAGAPAKKTRLGLILLVIAGIVSALFVLQQFGVKSVDRSETDRWVDHNSQEEQNRAMPKRRTEEESPVVQQTLNDIAEEFKGPVFSDIRTANTQKGWGLPDDEAKFYDEMRAKYAKTNTDPQGWLSVVKKSYSTYKTVKEIFGGKSDVSAMLQDAQTASHIYTQFQQTFGIPLQDSRTFAPSATTISDWARFAEKYH